MLIEGGDRLREWFDDHNAARAYRVALDLARVTASSGELVALAAERLARVVRYEGDPVRAELLLREALRATNVHTRLAAHRGLYRIACEWNLPDRAAAEARAAAGIALQLGDLQLITECYDELSVALRAAGRESDALAELHEGLVVATGGESIDAAKAPLVAVRLVVRLAERAVQGGQREAVARYVRAIARLIPYDNTSEDGAAWLAEAAQMAIDGDNETLGQSVAERALEALRQLGDRRRTATLLRLVASLAPSDAPHAIAALAEASRFEAALVGGSTAEPIR